MKWPARRLPVPRVRTLVVFLLLGAAVNVAVAWGCCLHNQRSGVSIAPYLAGQEDIAWWRSHSPAGFPDAPVGVQPQESFGAVSTFMWEREPDTTSNTLGDNCLWISTGWPMHSLEGGIWVDRQVRIATYCTAWRPTLKWMEGWLPFAPLPLGFAVNTGFYAGILLVLFLVAQSQTRRARRRRRIKRGLCPVCAYPVGASDLCTECGKPVKAQTHEARSA